jgi:hypothetical protein
MFTTSSPIASSMSEKRCMIISEALIALRKKWRFLHVYDPRVIAPMVDLAKKEGCFLSRSPTKMGRPVRLLNPTSHQDLVERRPQPECVPLPRYGLLPRKPGFRPTRTPSY